MNNLKQGESLLLKNPTLKVGLSWDKLGIAPIDLDASCVAFNDYGKIIDAVYYNQTKIMDGSITHSGDNRTGNLKGDGEGDEEVIMIDLMKINSKVKALVILITCYNKGDFTSLETAKASLMDGKTNENIVNIFLGCQGKHTGLIMATIYKDDQGLWYIKNISHKCNARDFLQAESEMKEQLHFLIPIELMNEMKWDSKQEKPFNLKKDDVVLITGNKFTLGLGWDTRCDLDANCSLISYDTNKIEHVYFSRKLGTSGCVVHSGDNLTGEGEGDDEKIFVDLGKVPDYYSTLIFSICVYSLYKDFSSVEGAYVRMLDEKGKEMLRYQLSGKYNSNAMIMCKLERNDKSKDWRFKAIGEGAFGRKVNEITNTLKSFHFKNEHLNKQRSKEQENYKRNDQKNNSLLKIVGIIFLFVIFLFLTRK